VLAQNIIGLYNANASIYGKVSPANRDAAGALLKVADVKRNLMIANWAVALDLIASLDIVPVNSRGDVALIRQAAHRFGQMHENLQQVVPALLLWTIEACSRQSAELKRGGWEDGTRKEVAQEVANKAKSSMMYAGMVQYRLPPQVYERIGRGVEALS
jgi:nuclear pore complex protein Nup93